MIVFAVNVHVGGGRVLLDELLVNKPFGPITCLFCDRRYHPPSGVEKAIQIFPIQPTIWGRLRAEFTLRRLAKRSPNTLVLFFGNLPPMFRIPNQTVLYLQNYFLVRAPRFFDLSIKANMRLAAERIWLRLFLPHISEVWVQSGWFRELVVSSFPRVNKVEVRPFLPKFKKVELKALKDRKFDVISVTGLAKYKGLHDLVAGLEVLDGKLNRNLRVLIILAPFERSKQLEEKQFSRIHLEVKNDVAREEMFRLYGESRICVVTSENETFCLPLFEAHQHGAKILANDRPYARSADFVTDFYSGGGEAIADALSNLLSKV